MAEGKRFTSARWKDDHERERERESEREGTRTCLSLSSVMRHSWSEQCRLALKLLPASDWQSAKSLTAPLDLEGDQTLTMTREDNSQTTTASYTIASRKQQQHKTHHRCCTNKIRPTHNSEKPSEVRPTLCHCPYLWQDFNSISSYTSISLAWDTINQSKPFSCRTYWQSHKTDSNIWLTSLNWHATLQV